MATPFMPLFFGDFLASTPTWDGEERSLYLLMLAYQWSAGPLPNDVKRLSKMCQYDFDRFESLWIGAVRSKFDETPEGLINLRLEEHRKKALAIASKNAESGRRGAAKRWQSNGERHSERHESANGEFIASIPNHTIPIKTIDIAPPSPPKGGKRAMQMPEGFSPSPAHETMANQLGINLATEFDAFTDFHRSKGSTFKDWDAALRTWLRNAKKFNKPARAVVPQESAFDRFMRINGGKPKAIEHD